MRVGLYARVSSKGQKDDALPIEGQLTELRDYVAERPDWHIISEFIDEALSGRTDNRPALQEMLSLALSSDKPFDVILMWKSDRFFRNAEEAAYYRASLRRRGVDLVSISEPVVENPFIKRQIENFYDAAAEHESDKISRNVRRGQKQAAKKGYTNGGKVRIGYQFDRIPDPDAEGDKLRIRLKPDPKYRQLVERAFEFADTTDYGAGVITQMLVDEGFNHPNGGPIRYYHVNHLLKNPTYLGHTVWTDKDTGEVIENKDTHPALVSEERFARVQQKIRNRRLKGSASKRRRRQSRFLLNGILWCSRCGSRVWGHTKKKDDIGWYVCGKRINEGRTACNHKMVPVDQFHGLIFDLMEQQVLTPKGLEGLYAAVEETGGDTDSQARAQHVEDTLRDQRERLARLWVAYEDGNIELADLKPRMDALKEKIAALESEQVELARSIQMPAPLPERSELLLYMETLGQALRDEATTEERADIIHSMVDRIVINWPTVTVHLHLAGREAGTVELDLRSEAPEVPTVNEMKGMNRMDLVKLARQIKLQHEQFPFQGRDLYRLHKTPLIEMLDQLRP